MGCEDDDRYLVVHNNTGVSKLELYSAKENKRVAAVKSVNLLNHLNNNIELMTGDHITADHWIQEIF